MSSDHEWPAIAQAPDVDRLLRAFAAELARDPDRGVNEFSRLRTAYHARRRALAGEEPIRVRWVSQTAWIEAWLRPDTPHEDLVEMLHAAPTAERDHAERLLPARDDWQRLEGDAKVWPEVLNELRGWIRTGDARRARKKIRLLALAHGTAAHIRLVYPAFFAAAEPVLRPLIDRAYARELKRTERAKRRGP